MSDQPATPRPPTVPPPSKHQLAVMIWLAVVPTLVTLNLALSHSRDGLPVVARTFVLAPVAVPIVIYGLMPQPPSTADAAHARRAVTPARPGTPTCRMTGLP